MSPYLAALAGMFVGLLAGLLIGGAMRAGAHYDRRTEKLYLESLLAAELRKSPSPEPTRHVEILPPSPEEPKP